MVGERIEALDLLIDGLREDERIEPLAEGEQGLHLRPIMLRGGRTRSSGVCGAS
jgi:hypothetical protein